MIWNCVVVGDWKCNAASYIGTAAVVTATVLGAVGAAAPVAAVGTTVGVATAAYQMWNCS